MKRYLIDSEYDKYGDAPVLCNFDSPNYHIFKNSIDNGQPYLGGKLDFFYFDVEAIDYDWFNISSLYGVVITKKLFDLFSNKSLKGFNFYPCQVRRKDGSFLPDFYFIHSITDYTKLIDYKKTDFVFAKFGVLKTSITELSDNSNFEAIKSSKKGNNNPFTKVWPRDKFHFLDEVGIDQYDLVCINYFNPHSYYVSDTLKKEMERLPVRGVSFLETEHL